MISDDLTTHLGGSEGEVRERRIILQSRFPIINAACYDTIARSTDYDDTSTAQVHFLYSESCPCQTDEVDMTPRGLYVVVFAADSMLQSRKLWLFTRKSH